MSTPENDLPLDKGIEPLDDDQLDQAAGADLAPNRIEASMFGVPYDASKPHRGPSGLATWASGKIVD